VQKEHDKAPKDLKDETDELKRQLEERIAAKYAAIEAGHQAALYAIGLAEAATQEQYEREYQLAVESGDQRRIFEAQQALRKFEIDEEYAQRKAELDAQAAAEREALENEQAAKQTALDNRLAKEKAELEYRAATASWRIQLAQAAASAAQAVLAASVNPWPVVAVPMMAMAGAMGAAQIALVASNKPKMQAFEKGGIVPGSSFSGDAIAARVNSGEMILNRRQQKNMFDALDGGETGGSLQPVTVVIQTVWDGNIIAENTVNRVNNRQLFIKKESVV